MERAPILNQIATSCPICRSGHFITYTRETRANGTTVLYCRCRKCGLKFEVHEKGCGNS